MAATEYPPATMKAIADRATNYAAFRSRLRSGEREAARRPRLRPPRLAPAGRAIAAPGAAAAISTYQSVDVRPHRISAVAWNVHNEESDRHPDVFVCRQLKEPLPALWPRLRHFG